MERMFPQPVEFVKVDKFVIKDSKAPYDRYWNTNTNKWGGLIPATRFTKEEINNLSQLPENGQVLDIEEVIGVKKGNIRYG